METKTLSENQLWILLAKSKGWTNIFQNCVGTDPSGHSGHRIPMYTHDQTGALTLLEGLGYEVKSPTRYVQEFGIILFDMHKSHLKFVSVMDKNFCHMICRAYTQFKLGFDVRIVPYGTIMEPPTPEAI